MIGDVEEEEGGRLKGKARGAQVGITPASSSTTMLLHHYTTASKQPANHSAHHQAIRPSVWHTREDIGQQHNLSPPMVGACEMPSKSRTTTLTKC